MFSVLILTILVTIIEQLGLNLIAIYLIDVITIKIIYKKALKDVILGFFLVLLIEMSLQLILSLIINRFIYNEILRIMIIELIILVGVIIFSKINSLGKNIKFENINNNILICFILICSIYAIVLKIIWNYDNTIILNNLGVSVIIISLLAISQMIIYLYIIKEIREKEKLKIKNEYNSVIDETVQEIKQRQHDFINYKNTIRGIVEVLDEKDIRKAIVNYMKDEDTYDNKINELIYIDNVVIRSIIYRNMCKAKRHNINFKYQIANNVLDHILGYNEISNVLNNLLNNAFDEVIKDECTEKNIQIKILNKNKTPHLIVKNQIANSSDINLNEMFTSGYSTKSISTRGYGLYNVQQIINSHNGYIKIKVEFEEIIFDIYFNNSSG
ncbi:ATP-binding protein [Clostridium gelidum]|uniref:ATP-binding protein n=1 Tax=Clostridium gelidum TaxID=704125 RepID=UPI00288341E1|nr:ATP-binding protein [Clostridium gelidum]